MQQARLGHERHRCLWLVLGLLVLAASRPDADTVSTRTTNTWAVSGIVHAAVAASGVVYIGGDFSVFGPRTGPMTAVSRSTNEPMPWPRLTGGNVRHILPTPGGGYIVLGSFTAADGVPVAGLIRLTSDGHIDPAFQWSLPVLWNTAFLAADRLVVTASAASGSTLGSAVLDWRTGRLLAGPLSATLLFGGTGPGGTLIAAHRVSTTSSIVELHPDTAAVTRVVYTLPANQYVSAMVIDGTQAYVSTSNEGASGTVLRVDIPSGAVTPLATVAGFGGRLRIDPVDRMLYHRGRLYLCGALVTFNGVPVEPFGPRKIIAIDPTTGSRLSWQQPVNLSPVALLDADDDRLLVGDTSEVIALDADTGADTGWRLPLLGPLSGAMALIAEPDRLVIGGQFSGVGVTTRANLAAITLPDGRPTAWLPQAPPTSQLAVSCTRVFAVHGNADQMTEYDAHTGARASYTVTTSGRIRAMVVSGGRLFIAGAFTAVEGIPRGGIASFRLDTSPPTLESWTPGATGDVTSALPLGDAVVVAGRFSTPGGGNARLLALDAGSGAVLPWLPSVNERSGLSNPSLDVAATADRLFVEGVFDAVDGQSRPRLAAFDFTGRLLPWALDDARGIAETARPALLGEYLFVPVDSTFFGQAPGIAVDRATGRRLAWAAGGGTGTFGGQFLAVPGVGLLRHDFTISSASDEAGYSFYPLIVTPPAVTDVRAAVNGGVVRLDWSAATGATRYVVEAGSTVGATNLARVDTGSPATTFSATVPDGRYFVRVRGVNEAGSGPASSDVVVVVGDGACSGPPGAPGGLQATASGLSATLSWQAPGPGQPVTRYAIDLVPAAGPPVPLTHVTATTFTGTGAAGTYVVRVRAENACGTSAPTAPVTVTLARPAGE